MFEPVSRSNLQLLLATNMLLGYTNRYVCNNEVRSDVDSSKLGGFWYNAGTTVIHWNCQMLNRSSCVDRFKTATITMYSPPGNQKFLKLELSQGKCFIRGRV